MKYTLRNAGTVGHKVGLRFMLDTYIGENDGVPFTIPGKAGLCDTQQVFNTPAEIPDFIQALEHADLKNPGTVAHLTLKVLDSAGKIEPPSRAQLGAWPNQSLQAFGYPTALGSMTRWEVPLAPIRALPQQPDSAVTLYWDEKFLEPGQLREMAFAYGLGKVSSTGRGAGKLAVTVDGSFRPGRRVHRHRLRGEPRGDPNGEAGPALGPAPCRRLVRRSSGAAQPGRRVQPRDLESEGGQDGGLSDYGADRWVVAE